MSQATMTKEEAIAQFNALYKRAKELAAEIHQVRLDAAVQGDNFDLSKQHIEYVKVLGNCALLARVFAAQGWGDPLDYYV